MKTISLLLLVLSSGCWPPGSIKYPNKVCTSKCGMQLYAKTCDGFQEAEDRNLAVLGPVMGLSCSDLQGWMIMVVPYADEAGAFYTSSGQKVAGVNYYDSGEIELGTTDWKKSALAHELIHIKRHSTEDLSHTGWVETGLYKAIDECNK
jgi:hypothetical protein